MNPKNFSNYSRDIIPNFEKQIGKTIEKWDKDDVKKFLTAQHITSPNGQRGMITILKHLEVYKKDACEKSKQSYVSFESILTFDDIDSLYDYHAEFQRLITNDQFETIRDQIKELRGRVVLELAYLALLKNSQINELKNENVVVSEDGKSVAIRIIDKNGNANQFPIDDPSAIADIITMKRDIKQNRHFFQNGYNTQSKGIIPISTALPVLKNALIGVECDNLNLSDFNIEDFRKSRLVYYYHLVKIGKMQQQQITWIMGKPQNYYSEHHRMILADMLYGDK